MSDTKALPNAALLSHSNDKHNLPPLSTAPLSHSGSKHPTGYSDSPPSYSPSHSRESNSPPKLSQRYSYSSLSSYLLMPTLLVYNPVLSSKCLPLYSNDNSPLHSSPHSEPTTVDPSYLLSGHNSVYPYLMTPASAAMMSQLPSTIVPSSNLLPQPLTPVRYKTKPAPKRRKKYACRTCCMAFSCNAHLVRHVCMHTGEKNHECPFPGCEVRCLRADNLQQHFCSHFMSRSRRQTIESTVMYDRIANLMRNTVHDGHGQWDPWLPSVCLLPVLQSYGCEAPLPVTL